MYCDVHESARARNWLNSCLLLGTAAVALLASPAAFANPKDGTVTSGSATISSSSQLTTIDQTSQGVVIDWSSFNIGNRQTTQFLQPNSSSVAINRIGSASASSILGTLDANGRVALINGNGLAFGRNSQVNVGSLIATTTGGSDSDLLAGKFTKAGNQNASVVNRGTITAAGGGTVALVAPNVTNRGTVQAKLGTVSLGAANAFTVDFAGDGLVSFAAQGDVNGKAQVTNAGTLSGANVSMTARAAEGVATGVVNVRGTIQAQGAHNVGGTIVLDAGDGGSIDVSHASLNASGAKGGGTVTIGGWNQSSVVVDKHSIVNVSATKSGNGGTIDVTAAATSFRGQALASGGAQSGNGGNIETSGHVLDVNGAWISTTAAHGATGNWSLDPYDVTISNGGTKRGSVSGGIFTPTGDNSIFNAATLEGDLIGTSITITTGAGGGQPGDIIVASPLLWSSTQRLSLDAANAIYIDASIAITGGGGIDLEASNALLFDGGNIGFYKQVKGITQGNLTIGGDGYTLANNITQLASDISANPNGLYALAESYDAGNDNGGTPYTSPPIPTNFTGIFEGLGNTISNLSVNSAGDAGLFEVNGGTVRDIGLVNVSITGADYVGALVVMNEGQIVGAFATGSVSGSGPSPVGGLVAENLGGIYNSYTAGTVSGAVNGNTGGLVGDNNETISQSFSTAAVSGTFGSVVGGLVGFNESNGAIDNSYAMGSVTGTGLTAAGGLAGNNTGTISESYSATFISAPSATDVGGFIGEDTPAPTSPYTADYWDTSTSGVSDTTQAIGNLPSASGISGVPTTTLQAALDGTWSTGSWGILPNVSYPYLQWQVAPGAAPQVVSGIAANGATPYTQAGVGLLVNGQIVDPLASMSSGADGYYYLLLAPGAISHDADVLAYFTGGTPRPGNAYLQDVNGSQTDLGIQGGEIELNSDAAHSTTVMAGLDTAVGSQTGADFVYTSAGGFQSAFDVLLDDGHGTFSIDSTLDFAGDNVTIEGGSEVSENLTDGAIDAKVLGVAAYYQIALNGDNEVEHLSDFDVGVLKGKDFSISFTDDEALVVEGDVSAGPRGFIALTTVGAGNGISIGQNGEVSAGEDVTLNSAGGILESPTGIISASVLKGAAADTVNLSGANEVGDLNALAIATGDLTFNDDQTLVIAAEVSPTNGSGNITLTTTGAGSNITIDHQITTTGLVTLDSAGAITEGTVNGEILFELADRQRRRPCRLQRRQRAREPRRLHHRR